MRVRLRPRIEPENAFYHAVELGGEGERAFANAVFAVVDARPFQFGFERPRHVRDGPLEDHAAASVMSFHDAQALGFGELSHLFHVRGMRAVPAGELRTAQTLARGWIRNGRTVAQHEGDADLLLWIGHAG